MSNSGVLRLLADEAVTRAVLGRFNTLKNWQCATLDQLSERIDDHAEARLHELEEFVGQGHAIVERHRREDVDAQIAKKFTKPFNEASLCM